MHEIDVTTCVIVMLENTMILGRPTQPRVPARAPALCPLKVALERCCSTDYDLGTGDSGCTSLSLVLCGSHHFFILPGVIRGAFRFQYSQPNDMTSPPASYGVAISE